ncbi:MAG: hypothetical protein RI100_07970 [Nitrosarchaeum sp.]|uniref:hypothetical protein n=1 Tax=Nitrosarchaeum sp. TaxID=2026886 RepID=UPI002DF62B51|nr:hypothetical protein [Nitrosarchaeum sp.]
MKQLVEDEFVIKKNNGKITEYHVNQSTKDEFLNFRADEELDRLILENENVLQQDLQIIFFEDGDGQFEDTIQMLHNRIDLFMLAHRQRTILLNLIDMPTSLQNKHKKELEKLNLLIRQTLKIMNKISPKMRNDYESYLLKKVSEKNFQDIEWMKKEEKLFKQILKKHKKSISVISS